MATTVRTSLVLNSACMPTFSPGLLHGFAVFFLLLAVLVWAAWRRMGHARHKHRYLLSVVLCHALIACAVLWQSMWSFSEDSQWSVGGTALYFLATWALAHAYMQRGNMVVHWVWPLAWCVLGIWSTHHYAVVAPSIWEHVFWVHAVSGGLMVMALPSVFQAHWSDNTHEMVLSLTYLFCMVQAALRPVLLWLLVPSMGLDDIRASGWWLAAYGFTSVLLAVMAWHLVVLARRSAFSKQSQQHAVAKILNHRRFMVASDALLSRAPHAAWTVVVGKFMHAPDTNPQALKLQTWQADGGQSDLMAFLGHNDFVMLLSNVHASHTAQVKRRMHHVLHQTFAAPEQWVVLQWGCAAVERGDYLYQTIMRANARLAVATMQEEQMAPTSKSQVRRGWVTEHHR